MAIHAVIVDDESLVASSLATLIGLEEDIEVIAVLGSGEELVEWWQKQLTTNQPVADVIVTDLQMSGIDGIDAVARIHELSPDAKAMVVTSHGRPRQLKRALSAAILGFLPKTSTAQEFAAAIRAVNAGRRYLDPELAALAISTGESPLTERETDVVAAAGAGGSVEDIARQTFLAAGTVRNYLSSAMTKLGAQNRFEAFTIARDRGWI
ncbi:response regulator transcription factor [Corynebacterium lubricantis]|uniref:response regulator transcription factor n=1 Tax=Corynebacterium lubricantis TaxID=541095 RepID=UPI000368903B|nr:response regulator transcription factor [Corynebacterium lubricantis]